MTEIKLKKRKTPKAMGIVYQSSTMTRMGNCAETGQLPADKVTLAAHVMQRANSGRAGVWGR